MNCGIHTKDYVRAPCCFWYNWSPALIARFMGPTWGPSGADRTQVGHMLALWTLLSWRVWEINQNPLLLICLNSLNVTYDYINTHILIHTNIYSYSRIWIYRGNIPADLGQYHGGWYHSSLRRDISAALLSSACQISERLEKSKSKSRGFKASQDLEERRLTA